MKELLLLLCRYPYDPVNKDRLKELLNQVKDWHKTVELINEHGIIALCWYNIVETGNSSNIPPEYLEILHKGYLASLTRNAFIFSLLNEVLTLAHKGTIHVTLLKGLALEKTVYGDKGLRQMNDLDILVDRKDAIRLRNILLKNGFESMPIISPLHEKILPTYGKHLPEMYKNGLSVEIHFNLFEKAGRRLTGLFIEKSTAGSVNNNVVQFPSPQLFFLYLVKHLDKHEKEGTSQLRLYTDLVLILSGKNEEIVNEDLLILAKEACIENALIEKLFILKTFWEISFPGLPEEKLTNINTEIIIGRFIQFLHKPNNEQTEVNHVSLLEPISDIPGITEKLIFVIGYLVPSLTFMKFRYKTKSKVSAMFYYPVRWGKLAGMIVRGKV